MRVYQAHSCWFEGGHKFGHKFGRDHFRDSTTTGASRRGNLDTPDSNVGFSRRWTQKRHSEQLGIEPGDLIPINSKPAEVLSQTVCVVTACLTSSRGIEQLAAGFRHRT